MKNEEIVKFKYYDRITKKLINLEVTKEVKKTFDKLNEMEKYSNEKYKRSTISFEDVLDNNLELSLIDESGDPEKFMLDKHYEILNNIIKEQKRTILENALYELTDKQREVIEMVFQKNMSYSQISTKLNISKSGVSKRINNAIKNIKNYIIRGQH